MSKKFQTRSEETGLCYFDKLEDAFAHASEDASVHKISFLSENGNIVKFHRLEKENWKYELNM